MGIVTADLLPCHYSTVIFLRSFLVATAAAVIALVLWVVANFGLALAGLGVGSAIYSNEGGLGSVSFGITNAGLAVLLVVFILAFVRTYRRLSRRRLARVR
jgi:hypothetical protein